MCVAADCHKGGGGGGQDVFGWCEHPVCARMVSEGRRVLGWCRRGRCRSRNSSTMVAGRRAGESWCCLAWVVPLFRTSLGFLAAAVVVVAVAVMCTVAVVAGTPMIPGFRGWGELKEQIAPATVSTFSTFAVF